MTTDEALAVADHGGLTPKDNHDAAVNLAAEVRRLRQRHAEAVELLGRAIVGNPTSELPVQWRQLWVKETEYQAWLASEAKARLT